MLECVTKSERERGYFLRKKKNFNRANSPSVEMFNKVSTRKCDTSREKRKRKIEYELLEYNLSARVCVCVSLCVCVSATHTHNQADTPVVAVIGSSLVVKSTEAEKGACKNGLTYTDTNDKIV